MPTRASGLLHALITHDAIMWNGYVAFRLPFKITVAVGREWRGDSDYPRWYVKNYARPQR